MIKLDIYNIQLDADILEFSMAWVTKQHLTET